MLIPVNPRLNILSTSSGITLTMANEVVLVDASSGTVVITLPTAASCKNKVFTIKKIDGLEGSSYSVTIDGNSTEVVESSTVLYLYFQYDHVTIVSDGSKWHVISDGRKPFAARLTRATSQTLTYNTAVKLQLNSESYDYGNIADPTTNFRITIVRPGIYDLTGFFCYAEGSSTGTIPHAFLFKNGNELIRGSLTGTSSTLHLSLAQARVSLTTSDYIELYAYTDNADTSNHTTSVSFAGFLPYLEVKEVLR